MTQLELSNLARVSRGWVSRVENGKQDAQWSLVFRVLGVLSLRLDVHGAD